MKKICKTYITVLLLLAVLLLLNGCKGKTVYLPVETINTEKEYIDRWHKDSIYIKDSIIINKAGDTIYIEKYKYIYKDKLIRDSIFITDSIKIKEPYPVEVEKEVNRLTSFQSFQLWCGRILLLILLAYSIYIFIKKKLSRFIKKE